jgi:hypothetical protein
MFTLCVIYVAWLALYSYQLSMHEGENTYGNYMYCIEANFCRLVQTSEGMKGFSFYIVRYIVSWKSVIIE